MLTAEFLTKKVKETFEQNKRMPNLEKNFGQKKFNCYILTEPCHVL
jgi:hypothetical protein